MLEYFDGGARWCQGAMKNQDGQLRCLIGTLRHVRRLKRIRGAGTAYYLTASAVEQMEDIDFLRNCTGAARFTGFGLWPSMENNLMEYNDGCESYDELRALIVDAIALAQAELDATRERRRAATLTQPDPEYHSALMQIESEEAH